jgi:DNA primase
MPGIDFRRLRAEVTMEQVLTLLGFTATYHRGVQWYGACPLHESSPRRRTRSFSVNVAIGCYYCHKCRSHGNQLKLWAEACQLPIHPAAILLCQRLGKQVPWIQPPTRLPHQNPNTPPQKTTGQRRGHRYSPREHHPPTHDPRLS